MNGNIEVESEFGVGSIFRITIPQQIADEASVKSSDSPEADASKDRSFKAPDAKILVVDDNSVNLYVAKSLLGLYDITATCVLSGELAIQAVEKNRFDLILMDYMMPHMDGIETMKKIRALHPEYKDIPIIAFTANAVEEARDLLLHEGMDDFIAKPVKAEELEALLRKWLGRKED